MDFHTKILLLEALLRAEEDLLKVKDLTIFEYVLHYREQDALIRRQHHTINNKKFIISQLKRKYGNKMSRKRRKMY